MKKSFQWWPLGVLVIVGFAWMQGEPQSYNPYIPKSFDQLEASPQAPWTNTTLRVPEMFWSLREDGVSCMVVMWIPGERPLMGRFAAEERVLPAIDGLYQLL